MQIVSGQDNPGGQIDFDIDAGQSAALQGMVGRSATDKEMGSGAHILGAPDWAFIWRLAARRPEAFEI